MGYRAPAFVLIAAVMPAAAGAQSLTPKEPRAIAKKAHIYGYPPPTS